MKSKAKWVEETQRFQRIANVPVTPTEELERDYEAALAAHRQERERRRGKKLGSMTEIADAIRKFER